jgi:ribosomal protein S27AE
MAAVVAALRGGVLRRKPCELCGDPEAMAHHDDYDRPLDVRWLCRSHHTLVHKALNAVRDPDPSLPAPPTISVGRLKLTIGQIASPVMVVTYLDGEYRPLGMWVPAKRLEGSRD